MTAGEPNRTQRLAQAPTRGAALFAMLAFCAAVIAASTATTMLVALAPSGGNAQLQHRGTTGLEAGAQDVPRPLQQESQRAGTGAPYALSDALASNRTEVDANPLVTQVGGGGGHQYHYENSDIHYSSTNYHYLSTDTHFVNTDVHSADSGSHSGSTDTHYSPSDIHHENSDWTLAPVHSLDTNYGSPDEADEDARGEGTRSQGQ